MTETKDGGGCDFPQGIIGLIVTLEMQRQEVGVGGGGLLAFSKSPGARL